MKYIILISSVILLFSCQMRKNSTQSGLYKVYKIDSINSFYSIYCKKDNINYKVISKNNSDNEKVNLKKITIGNYYNFELISFPDYSQNKDPLTGFGSHVDCFMLDKDTKICKEEGINGLYTTKNLIGLYYVK